MRRVQLISPAEVREQVQARLAPPDAWALARISSTLHHRCGGWLTLVEHALSCGWDPWETVEDPLTHLSRRDSPAARWIDQQLAPSLSPQ